MLAFLTVDPRERIDRRDRLLWTMNQIRAGVPFGAQTISGGASKAVQGNRDERVPGMVDDRRPSEGFSP
jgi:hypothetical protein